MTLALRLLKKYFGIYKYLHKFNTKKINHALFKIINNICKQLNSYLKQIYTKINNSIHIHIKYTYSYYIDNLQNMNALF